MKILLIRVFHENSSVLPGNFVTETFRGNHRDPFAVREYFLFEIVGRTEFQPDAEFVFIICYNLLRMMQRQGFDITDPDGHRNLI